MIRARTAGHHRAYDSVRDPLRPLPARAAKRRASQERGADPARAAAVPAAARPRLPPRGALDARGAAPEGLDDGTFVDFERGLNFCILQVRTALGDDAKHPQYIETLPKRGYRFVGALKPAAAPRPR